MSPKGECTSGAQVPYFDSGITAAAGEDVGVKVEAYNAFSVAVEGSNTLSLAPIPDLESAVHAACDELDFIELQRPNRTGVSFQALEFNACLEVPHTDGAIVGTCDENRESRVREGFTELQTHDTICMTLQGADCTPASAPVPFDGHALAVDIFPGSCDRC